VITDSWKYIWYPEGGIAQLFDLEHDPLELTNVASSRPDVADRLRGELVAELVEAAASGGRPWLADWVVDGELVSEPLRGDTTRDRRARSWPGLHTEFYPVDVRH